MQQELHAQTYVTYAVGIVSKFNAAPTQAHLTAVKRIFRYLKLTIELKLQYRPDSENLLGYSDADWAMIWMTDTQQPAMFLQCQEELAVV